MQTRKGVLYPQNGIPPNANNLTNGVSSPPYSNPGCSIPKWEYHNPKWDTLPHTGILFSQMGFPYPHIQTQDALSPNENIIIPNGIRYPTLGYSSHKWGFLTPIFKPRMLYPQMGYATPHWDTLLKNGVSLPQMGDIQTQDNLYHIIPRIGYSTLLKNG